MVPIDEYNMVGPLRTSNLDERTIPKGRLKGTTSTTNTTMPTLITSNYNKSNNIPGRGRKHHVYIKPYGTIYIIMHKKYTGTIKKRTENQ